METLSTAEIEYWRAMSTIRPVVVGTSMGNKEYEKMKGHLKEIMKDVENYSALLKNSLVEIEENQLYYNGYIQPDFSNDKNITKPWKSYG